MKLFIALGLLFALASGEKKINLEDIERDNLRAESKVKSDGSQQELKYAGKANLNHEQQYQLPPSQYSGPSSLAPTSYVTPPPDVKYSAPPADYGNKYAGNDVIYQQNAVVPEQNGEQLQYYAGYQQHAEVSPKGVPTPGYEQPLLYQPEVVIGNQIQSVQQKAADEKYGKNPNRETVYVDIPMSQLFSYYPNLNVNSLFGAKSQVPSGQPLLQQLTSQAAQQISIPFYTPLFSQKQFGPIKTSFQIPTQYAAHYNLPAAFTTKVSKGNVYTPPAGLKKYVGPSFFSSPTHVQPDQHYSQAKKLFTQAYIAPQSYLQQLIYSQPGPIYSQPSQQIYADLYVRDPNYVQDNALRGHASQNIEQHQHQHLPPQPESQGTPQAYEKVPDEPSTHFVPPQLPAQNFKSGVTQLVPVSPSGEEEVHVNDQIESSEPRSLLDSYIPSKVIAAQDSARYKERPLHLEGGFLPSKVNFVQSHKKRKSQ